MTRLQSAQNVYEAILKAYPEQCTLWLLADDFKIIDGETPTIKAGPFLVEFEGPNFASLFESFTTDNPDNPEWHGILTEAQVLEKIKIILAQQPLGNSEPNRRIP